MSHQFPSQNNSPISECSAGCIRNKIFKLIIVFIFAFYLVAVAFVYYKTRYYHPTISLLDHIRYNSNFIPFKTVLEYAEHIKNETVNFDSIMWNLLGNLILYLPFGGFLPLIFSKLRSFKKTICVSLAVIFLAELSQMLFKYGRFDVDDIILNTAGAAVGYLIWKLFDRFCSSHKLKYI